MTDDKIKDIFTGFNPRLSSDIEFTEKLDKKLIVLERLKSHSSGIKARSRRAAVIAACVGFTVGLIASLFLPYISHTVVALQSSLSSTELKEIIINNYSVALYLIISTVSVIASKNAYDLYMSLRFPPMLREC